MELVFRTTAEEVSRYHPTMVPWVRSQVRSDHVRYVVEKRTGGKFSPSTSISRASSHSTGCSTHLSPGAARIGSAVGGGGLGPTPAHEIQKSGQARRDETPGHFP
jgi:hypothetical protein